MAIVDFPTNAAFQGAQFSLLLNTSERSFTGFFTGNRTTRSNSADRLGCLLKLPPVKNRVQAAAREAFIISLRSTGDHVRFGMPHRPLPLGLMRGAATVASSMAAGARTVALSGVRAGSNLLRLADDVRLFNGPSGTNNATASLNSVTDPNGGTTAWTLNRTATGNHFCWFDAPLATTLGRTVTAKVWIRSGTLTGDVVLRLRDGTNNTDYSTFTITPTSTWTEYSVSATYVGAPAADLRLFVDPPNDTGSAGDSLQLWFSTIIVHSGLDIECTSWMDIVPAPSGQNASLAMQVRRLTSGANAYIIWEHATTAHAGGTYTFSVWLRRGTYTGDFNIYLRDGSGAALATSFCSASTTWTRFSVTATFGATPAANIRCYIDPVTDSGSVGETFEVFGVLLNVGSAADTYYQLPTAMPGDFIGVGGNLLQVASPGATGDLSGAISLPLTTPAQRAAAAGAAVVISAPTGVWELEDTGLQLDYTAPIIQGPLVLRFRQVPQ